MKLKSVFCSVAALSMMGAMASCQNEDAPKMPEMPGRVDLTDAETVSVAVRMPGDLKTRAAKDPVMSYGTDGLYSFTRPIDKLWYAVYNNGTLLYHSVEPGINQAVYDADADAFTLDIQIPKTNGDIKLSEYSVFFFAGNSADKVDTKEITDGVGLDFATKTMYAYPTMLNKSVASGEYFNPQQYDYFAKYTTLDKVVNTSGNANSVVLTRPFCQVSLLTDELCQPAVLGVYASDDKVLTVATPSVYTETSSSNTKTLPYAWNYGSDQIMTKEIPALAFTLSSRAFNNAEGSLTIPQEVTFKTRKMFCVASYLMLAPNARKAYSAGSTKEEFTFDLQVSGNRSATDANVAAAIPAGGFKANEKYVMYNKEFDPNDPDNPNPGPGGILSSHYMIDIVVDPAWEGNKDLSF